MKQKQIRRLLVLDRDKRLVGIVSWATRRPAATPREVGEVPHDVPVR